MKLLRLFLVAASCLAAGAAAADPLLTGIVLDSGLQPLAGATIDVGTVTLAVPVLGYSFVPYGTATSGADGRFQVPNTANVAPGISAIVIVKAAGHSPAYVDGSHCVVATSCLLWPSMPSVVVPAQDLGFVLPRTASIEGTVTRRDDGSPVPHQTVTLRAPGGAQAQVITDAQGRFRQDGLYPTSYGARVFSPPRPLLPQGYPGVDSDPTVPQNDYFADLTLVTTVEGGVVGGVDFPLTTGARISGHISSSVDHAGLDAGVYVKRLTPTAAGSYTWVAGGVDYESAGLLPGSFLVRFASYTRFAPDYFPDAADESAATPVTLGAGEARTGIDANLTPRRSIAGTVTDAVTQQPLADVPVHLGSAPVGMLNDVAVARTDAQGHYFIQNIDASSTYWLWTEAAQGYVNLFYPQAPCCKHYASAPAVAVGDAQALTDMDFALQPGAFISGVVKDAQTGAVDPTARVTLFNADDYSPHASVDADGRYTTAGVPSGTWYASVQTRIGGFTYPNIACPPYCDTQDYTPLILSAPGEYSDMDFLIPHLDLLFQGGFD